MRRTVFRLTASFATTRLAYTPSEVQIGFASSAYLDIHYGRLFDQACVVGGTITRRVCHHTADNPCRGVIECFKITPEFLSLVRRQRDEETARCLRGEARANFEPS